MVLETPQDILLCRHLDPYWYVPRRDKRHTCAYQGRPSFPLESYLLDRFTSRTRRATVIGATYVLERTVEGA